MARFASTKTLQYIVLFALVGYVCDVYFHIVQMVNRNSESLEIYEFSRAKDMKEFLIFLSRLKIRRIRTDTLSVLECLLAISYGAASITSKLIVLELVLVSVWETLGSYLGGVGHVRARDPLILLNAKERTWFERLVLSTAWFIYAVWFQASVFFLVYAIQWHIYDRLFNFDRHMELGLDCERVLFYTSVGVAAILSLLGSEVIMGREPVVIKVTIRAGTGDRSGDRTGRIPVSFN